MSRNLISPIDSQIPARKGGVNFMKYVLMCDFNGVLVGDLIPQILRLSLGIIKKHLGVSLTGKEAKEKLDHSSGGSIRDSLEILFPEFDKEKLRDCIKEIHQSLDQLEVKTLPKVKETLQYYSNKGFVLVISSNAPEQLILNWIHKEGISFDVVFGEEHGRKKEHVKRVRQHYHPCRIFFVSDSVGDIGLGDIFISVAAKGDEIRYFDAGTVTVINSFSEIMEKNLRAI
jgi:phosphoglycolate phosphatase-like HAD superfamily hydrolase